MKFKYLLTALLCTFSFAACKSEPIDPPADKPTSNDIVLSDSSFFREQRLYAPGDYGSLYWRIPAIITLDDGTLLAVNDKRKYNEGDLPEDIDIVVRRSADQGLSWSDPITMVQGTGRKHGFGDPALVQCANGDVLCLFVGGNGLWASTEADPIRSYVCRSSDRGATWSAPEDITSLLWGSQSANTATRNYKGSFFGSGNALRLTRGTHKDRIIVVAAMVRKSANILDNFAVYSDDNGHTWQVSERAFLAGDEAKVVELVDGSVLMSIRQNGPRGKNISTDGGATWGAQSTWPEMSTNACNGDLLRVSATDRGGKRNILLHSIPNSMNREKVSIYVSYDEGLSWQHPVLLFEGPSVYSSLTLQRNGTIGAYIEKNPNGACELWYQNFTLPWIENQ